MKFVLEGDARISLYKDVNSVKVLVNGMVVFSFNNGEHPIC